MGKAWSTLGSAQGYIKQKNPGIFKHIDDSSVNMWFLRNCQNTRQETRWFWKCLWKVCCMCSGMTPSSVERAEKSGQVLGKGENPCPHLSLQPGLTGVGYNKEAISWELNRKVRKTWARKVNLTPNDKGKTEPHFPCAPALEWEGWTGKFPLKFWPLQAQSSQCIKEEAFKSAIIYTQSSAPQWIQDQALESTRRWVRRDAPEIMVTGGWLLVHCSRAADGSARDFSAKFLWSISC